MKFDDIGDAFERRWFLGRRIDVLKEVRAKLYEEVPAALGVIDAMILKAEDRRPDAAEAERSRLHWRRQKIVERAWEYRLHFPLCEPQDAFLETENFYTCAEKYLREGESDAN